MPTNKDPKIGLGDILIVDDETPNLQLLSELLSRKGYQVRPANNPQLAIDSALAQPPSLILLDVRMPEIDGFEVCRLLKQDKRTRDIPILFISALQDVQDRVRGFEAGAVDFISKPIQEEEVLARLRTHLTLRNMQLHLEELVAQRTAELTATNEELAKSEAKYRGLVDTSLVGVFHSRMDGQLIFANQALARMFDFDSREQFLAAGALSRWADPNQRDLFLTTLQEQGSVTNFETETITHTGRNIHVIFSATLKGDSISGMVMDITARRQAEQKLQDYQQRLKALAFQLTVAEENERRNIAADLHDNVGQSLVFARMALSNLVETTLEPEETAAVKEISDALLAALQETRSLVFELSSPAINELGLSAALSEWLDEQTGKRYGLQTEFIDNMDDRHRNILNDDVRTLLFRNVRELLTNVVKHARANTVRVQLKSDINKLKIMVEDDGVGFAPEEINNDSGRAEHYGLFSIQERMADLGGSFEIETSPGKGCKVFLNVPVEKDKH